MTGVNKGLASTKNTGVESEDNLLSEHLQALLAPVEAWLHVNNYART